MVLNELQKEIEILYQFIISVIIAAALVGTVFFCVDDGYKEIKLTDGTVINQETAEKLKIRCIGGFVKHGKNSVKEQNNKPVECE